MASGSVVGRSTLMASNAAGVPMRDTSRPPASTQHAADGERRRARPVATAATAPGWRRQRRGTGDCDERRTASPLLASSFGHRRVAAVASDDPGDQRIRPPAAARPGRTTAARWWLRCAACTARNRHSARRGKCWISSSLLPCRISASTSRRRSCAICALESASDWFWHITQRSSVTSAWKRCSSVGVGETRRRRIA